MAAFVGMKDRKCMVLFNAEIMVNQILKFGYYNVQNYKKDSPQIYLFLFNIILLLNKFILYCITLISCQTPRPTTLQVMETRRKLSTSYWWNDIENQKQTEQNWPQDAALQNATLENFATLEIRRGNNESWKPTEPGNNLDSGGYVGNEIGQGISELIKEKRFQHLHEAKNEGKNEIPTGMARVYVVTYLPNVVPKVIHFILHRNRPALFPARTGFFQNQSKLYFSI